MVEEMTYKLNSELNKIESPINLIFPNGESKKYVNGEAVTEEVFTQLSNWTIYMINWM